MEEEKEKKEEDLASEEPTSEKESHSESTPSAEAERNAPEEAKLVQGEEMVGKEGEEEEVLDQEEIDSILNQIETSQPERSFDFPEAEKDQSGEEVSEELDLSQVELLKDVHVRVRVELGRGSMYLRDILKLREGSVVELEKLAGDPLDIYVNDRLVAKGEVLVLNENFCIRVTEIYSPKEVLRLKS